MDKPKPVTGTASNQSRVVSFKPSAGIPLTDAGRTRCIERILPHLTLIGPDAGRELRELVYGK